MPANVAGGSAARHQFLTIKPIGNHYEWIGAKARIGIPSGLDALGVEENPAIARLVKFTEQDALPLAQKHLPVNNRHSYRGLPNHHLPAMGMAVDELVFLEILSTNRVVIVLVIGVFRNKIPHETSEIVEEAGLRLVHNDGGCRVWAVDRDLAVTDPGSSDDLAGEIGDVPEFHRFRRCEVKSLSPNGWLF